MKSRLKKQQNKIIKNRICKTLFYLCDPFKKKIEIGPFENENYKPENLKMKTILKTKKSYVMKKNYLTFGLLAIFAIALSSCSRGHGCYYSASEIKELEPITTQQANDVLEVDVSPTFVTEKTEIAD